MTISGRGVIDLGLERIMHALHALGNPQTELEIRGVKIIHVTGTNGKGSVVEMISNGLLVDPKSRVGVFTSPFVICERDSIRIMTRTTTSEHTTDIISAADLERIRSHVSRSLPEDLGDKITEFEFLWIKALLYFSSQLDLTHLVVEVGMGGRLDATNIFARTNACVITSISMDHEKFLGNSLESICTEKSKIIKPGSIVVVSGTIPEKCLLIAENEFTSVGGRQFIVVDPSDTCDLDPPFNGHHQRLLMGMAFEVVTSVLTCAVREDVIRAIKKSKLPGRLERRFDYNRVPFPLILDGAHNQESAIALRQFVEDEKIACGKFRIVWIIATSDGRENAVVSNLLRPEDECICIEFQPYEKGKETWISCVPSSTLAISASRHCQNVVSISESTIADAIEYIRATKSIDWISSSLFVVAGSLYLVRNYLQYVVN
jgi:folylpolyglutamate synthase/dihydrofolate synthase